MSVNGTIEHQSRWASLTGIAVSLFLLGGAGAFILLKADVPRLERAPSVPADVSPNDPREAPPFTELVGRWMAGKVDDGELLRLGRKTLPALRARKETPAVRAMIDRIEARPVRVLYVEHPPRYEFRFLKNALIRDPGILLQCFVTSADSGFPQEHTRSDDPDFREPLKEFPREMEKLLRFDVVIYGDVDPAILGPGAAENLARFSRRFGGGIVFISGIMNSLRRLASVLPVVPLETRDLFEFERLGSEILGYRLTPERRDSPLVNFPAFGGDRAKNREHWEDRKPPRDGLMGIRWLQRVEGVHPEAKVLVEAVDRKGGRFPLFATRRCDRGRVFWSATDETWLWRYLVGDSPWFLPFWRGVIDWAAGPTD